MNPHRNTLKTRLIVEPSSIKREWHLIDAKGQILGRISTQIAGFLAGRGKASWSPMQDGGDHVVVINTAQVRLSGRKAETKRYYHHSTYLGHLKVKTFQQLQSEKPNEIVRKAVFGMLPRKRIRKTMLQRLHLYPADKHPYADKIASKNA